MLFSLLTVVAVPLIFVGGCLTAVGIMGKMGSAYIAAGHTSNTDPRPASMADLSGGGRGKRKLVRLGMKLLALGCLLLFVASF